MISILANLIGVLGFLFIAWRRLKEDYSAEAIFSLCFLILIGLWGGELAAGKYFPAWWFWLAGFGAFLGFAFGVVKYNFKFFETFEAVFAGFLPWLTFFYLLKTPLVSLFILGLGGLFVFLEKKYKTFLLYRSGRIGLAGVLTAAVFFLGRIVLATFFGPVLSLAGKSEIILSLVCFSSLVLLIVNLAKAEK